MQSGVAVPATGFSRKGRKAPSYSIAAADFAFSRSTYF